MSKKFLTAMLGLMVCIIAGCGSTTSATSGTSSAGRSTTRATRGRGKVYNVGDKGPAGGIVFFDNGDNDSGWRYLEAAPASTEGKAQWSVSGFDAGAKEVDAGTGKQNTRNIMDASVQAAVNAPAARLCDRLKYGGYDDWYLPSKNELGLMYMNLKVDGLGGFGSGWYWSSSEYGTSNAWGQQFSDGAQGYGSTWDGNKHQTLSVRAIRQF